MNTPTPTSVESIFQKRHIANMSLVSSSPTHKLSISHRTASQDSTNDGIRKRVCKACDRCRLKKSKCDGSNPCTRCKADNAICVFGERKKAHDKVYPKGYVEMLEQQQAQLVSGLQELYRRLQSAKAWHGKHLSESNGHPLTHDILAALNLLEVKHDGSGQLETFEEDVQKIQSRLLAEGNGYVQQRRGSISSDSEHSQHGHTRSATVSSIATVPSRSVPFRESFNFGSTMSSPLMQSPVPLQRQPVLSAQPSPVQSSFQHSDPQLYAPEWAQALSEATMQQHAMQQTKLAYPLQQQQQQQQQQPLNNAQANVDIVDVELMDAQWSPNLEVDSGFNTYAAQYAGLQALGDMSALDGVELDFSKFVNPSTAMEVYI